MRFRILAAMALALGFSAQAQAQKVVVYTAVGWVAFLALPQLFSGLGGMGFAFVISGGLAYTVGAVVYATKWPDPWPTVFGYHEVFHALTLVGAGLHLAAIAFAVLPRA